MPNQTCSICGANAGDPNCHHLMGRYGLPSVAANPESAPNIMTLFNNGMPVGRVSEFFASNPYREMPQIIMNEPRFIGEMLERDAHLLNVISTPAGVNEFFRAFTSASADRAHSNTIITRQSLIDALLKFKVKKFKITIGVGYVDVKVYNCLFKRKLDNLIQYVDQNKQFGHAYIIKKATIKEQFHSLSFYKCIMIKYLKMKRRNRKIKTYSKFYYIMSD